MSNPISTCSDRRLWTLLQSDNESGELRESAEHVDRCPRCQSRLEQLAAKPSEWDIAKVSLIEGESENQGGVAAIQGRPWIRQCSRNAAAWTELLARQLLNPPSHPEMLGRIGRYEVERLIGSGGMGIVFKAFDTELNRPVAVKVLAPYLAGSGAARKRFAREARAAAAVVHEHVVAIHNVETEGTSPFLVMPFVAGESLQQRIDREGPLELCETLRIAMQTASGLAAAHAQGLVHRDVKPSNILLEKGVERALLTDFGLARASDDASLTHTGYHPGTPQYMSPEQARGENVDARSDLFSLGSVIYSMCTGRPPFRAETSFGILRRITDNEPRSIRELNPAIPEWLEAIVAKLLAKTPAERFQLAEEVAGLLEQCLAHIQQPNAVALPAPWRGIVPMVPRESMVVPGRTILNTWNACSIKLRVGLIVCGAAIIILLGANGVHRLKQSEESPTHLAADAGSDAGVRPNATDPAVEWQAGSREISSFARDLAPFEIRSQQLWDDAPTMIKE